MTPAGPASDERLDELYREHPEGFVVGRDRLAKDLRAAGDRDGAGRVKKLRRPSVAAWLINRVALESPAQLEDFAEASRELEDAQARALEGADEGADRWRAAAAREREATGAVVDSAESLARAAGHPANRRALELVGETLRAATGDPELRERVLAGRVERERSAATLGTPEVGPPPGRKAGSGKPRGRAQARGAGDQAHREQARARREGDQARREEAQARRAVAAARRELERLQAELADATAREARLRGRVEQTEEALRQERTRLADSKRETTALRRRVKATERRARG